MALDQTAAYCQHFDAVLCKRGKQGEFHAQMVDRICLHGRRARGQARGGGQGGLPRVELFENDLTFFTASRGTCGGWRGSRARNRRAPAAARFRGDARADPGRRNFERAARKLELMHELGASSLPLLQVSPESDRRSGASRGRPGRTRRSRPPARRADRLRGARLGPAREGLDGRLGDRGKADQANLGIVLDSFHICVRGNPIEPIAALPAERSRSCRSLTRRRW